jgi:phosphoribosylanthranilate isomerase
MSKIEVKICGVKTQEALVAAAEGGAAYVGFNFYPPSPRYVAPVQAAELSRRVPPGMKSVAVTVDADDALVDEIFRHFTPDFIQLHGKEPPRRAADLKARWETPIIRALPIATAESFDAMKVHEDVADYYLFDAAPPPGAVLPGGNAASFDWNLLRGQSFAKPWFLSGGLNARNLREAIARSGATRVDLSSGVERAPGEKDPAMIEDMLRLAARLSS